MLCRLRCEVCDVSKNCPQLVKLPLPIAYRVFVVSSF